MNFLEWHGSIKLCRFQVYSSIILHHLYIVLCVHQPESTFLPYHLSPLLPSTCPIPASLWQPPYCWLCLGVLCLFIWFCLIPSPLSPCPPAPLTAVSVTWVFLVSTITFGFELEFSLFQLILYQCISIVFMFCASLNLIIRFYFRFSIFKNVLLFKCLFST